MRDLRRQCFCVDFKMLESRRRPYFRPECVERLFKLVHNGFYVCIYTYVYIQRHVSVYVYGAIILPDACRPRQDLSTTAWALGAALLEDAKLAKAAAEAALPKLPEPEAQTLGRC